jgi:gas vesicle protein
MNTERIYYSHDAQIHAMRIQASITLAFLTFGLAIGAVLALLFAPATGKTTRHDIVKGVEDGLQSGRERIKPMMKQAKKDLSEQIEKIN